MCGSKQGTVCARAVEACSSNRGTSQQFNLQYATIQHVNEYVRTFTARVNCLLSVAWYTVACWTSKLHSTILFGTYRHIGRQTNLILRWFQPICLTTVRNCLSRHTIT